MNKFNTLHSIIFIAMIYLSTCSNSKLRGTSSGSPVFLNMCESWDKDGNCVKCKDLYMLFKTKEGVPFCNNYIDGCQLYGWNGECVECQNGRTLHHNVSVSEICQCSPGTFNDFNSCIVPNDVNPNCVELESSESCRKCKDGFYRDMTHSMGVWKYICNSCNDFFGGGCKKCERESGMINCLD